MAQIKEVTTLNTVASVRKAAQESMKPVIDEIETKMKCLSRDMQEISANTKQIFEFQKKLKKSQEQNQYLQKQLMQVRQSNQVMQCQMISDRDRFGFIEQNIREQLRKFQKEKEKQDLVVQSMNQRNARIQKEMMDNLKNLKERESQMEIKFRKLNENSQKLSKEVKSNAADMKEEFDKMKATLNHQVKESSRRLQLLDMYETQREFINKELRSLNQKIDTLVSQEQLQAFTTANAKEQSKFAQSIRHFLEQNFSEEARQLIAAVPQIRIELSKCLTFEQTINKSKARILELDNQIQKLQNSYDKQKRKNKQELQTKFQSIRKQTEKIQSDIRKALSLQGLIQVRIDQYSDQLKAELRSQNQKKSRELYNEIKLMFADTREAMREKQLNNIIQQRKKLFDRCEDIQKLGGRIGEVLTTFSTKITKMKSDNELFIAQVRKQLQKLCEFETQASSNNQQIGAFLSLITESILTDYCININEDSHYRQEIFYTTKKDGVVFQKFQNSSTKGKITYRRKELESKLLRKAVISSLIEAYDKLMTQSNCLKWTKNSPWNHFKKQIEPIYRNLHEKKELLEYEQQQKTETLKETVQLSTIQARQTISTSYQRINRSRNGSSRKSKIERYEQPQTGSIFAHKSARRVRIHLNSSLGIS